MTMITERARIPLGPSAGHRPATGRAGRVDAQAVEAAEDAADSVRTYLTQIGRVPLLTKADEQRLSRALEEARWIEQLRTEYREQHGASPTWTQVFVELLRTFQRLRPVYQTVSRYLELPRQPVSVRIVDEHFRGCIDGTLNEGARDAVQRQMDWEPDQAHEALVELSVVTHILQPEHIAWAREAAGSEAKAFASAARLTEPLGDRERAFGE